MKGSLVFIFTLLLSLHSRTQTAKTAIEKAYAIFAADSQLKHATASLYVMDAKTGKTIFDHNSQLGLAPASTQKIITSSTAFDLLGKDFRYQTQLGYTGNIIGDSLAGSIYIIPGGDPSFGSWRYTSTEPFAILQSFTAAILKAGIKRIPDNFYLLSSNEQAVPDGWIMQDIGNYYGAGSASLNWKENQYELLLQSGNYPNGEVKLYNDDAMVETGHVFSNQLIVGEKGSGDNAYIYLPLDGQKYVLRGTIPPNESKFKISGAIANPPAFFLNSFRNQLRARQLLNANSSTLSDFRLSTSIGNQHLLVNYQSPSLDSIVYWFLKKSINLYGEALLNTLASQDSDHDGVGAIKNFWSTRGIDKEELNLVDGSGLSPLNRVTTHAQVEVLHYARSRSWYSYFFNSLPEFNGMKMKSGTINGVKAFCGYQQSKDGNDYIFSFIVNNFAGSSSSLISKMYKVLDTLK